MAIGAGSPGATRRLFIAVMLPEEVQQRLARLPRALDAHRANLRVVRPEALHFTLRFLGEQTEQQEQQAAEACAVAVRDIASFPLDIGGFGAFPDQRRPRVVWLGLRVGAEPLMALQRRVEGELLRRRIIARREEFTPHLTLARVRQDAAPVERAALGAALGALPPGEPVHCTAEGISLVHSVLTPRGSQYSTVGYWPLQ